jgi:hypothetical protein
MTVFFEREEIDKSGILEVDVVHMPPCGEISTVYGFMRYLG